MPDYTLHLISGPLRFGASEDDAKRLATELQTHNDEVVRLRAEVDALHADAYRYRWLRNHSTYTTVQPCVHGAAIGPSRMRWYHDSYQLNAFTLDAAIDAARAPQQAEPVAKIIRNDSGQVRMVDGSGEPFDMFAHVGQSYYAHPPAAEVQRLRDAAGVVMKQWAAKDDLALAIAMNELRRALEGGE